MKTKLFQVEKEKDPNIFFVETCHIFARVAPPCNAVRGMGWSRRKMGDGSMDFDFLEQFCSCFHVFVLLYVRFWPRNVVEGIFEI